jgi:hypothetical protein
MYFILSILMLVPAYANIYQDWQAETPSDIETVQPYDQDHVLVATEGDRNLHKMEINTGKTVWAIKPPTSNGNGGSFGDRNVVITSDINKDGYPDIIWGTAWASRSVYAISGKDGSAIWQYDTYKNPEGESGWVLDVAIHEDTNGDGIQEVLFITGEDDQSAYMIDGATGKFIWKKHFAWGSPQKVLSIPDINDDGVADVIVGMDSRMGMVYALSGKAFYSPETLWELHVDYTTYEGLVVEDIDQDGIRDIVINTWGGDVMALSSVDGSKIWEINTDCMNMLMAKIPDTNGDNLSEILVGTTNALAIMIDGLKGSVIWQYRTQGAVWAVDHYGDYDRDGINDVVVGDFGGNVHIIEGEHGGGLFSTDTGNDKIISIRTVRDINSDGELDILAASKYQSNTESAGKVFFISPKQ